MSHYNDFETTITDQEALVRALARCENRNKNVIQKNWIESHKEATNLYGYHGDKRDQVAHVIVRREHVGSAANDIGFVRNENGNFVAIISDFDKESSHGDRALNEKWLTKLYTYYNVEKSKMAFEEKGIECVESKDQQGRIQLRAKFKATSTVGSRLKVRR